MASFATEAARAGSIKTQTTINNFTDSRSGSRNYGTDTDVFAGLNSLAYPLIGMNANRIGAMKGKIDAYITQVNKILAEFDAKADPSIAFKGSEMEAAVISYLSNVKLYCQNLISYLAVFGDKLTDVKTAWERFDATQSQNVRAANNTFGNNTAYTQSTGNN